MKPYLLEGLNAGMTCCCLQETVAGDTIELPQLEILVVVTTGTGRHSWHDEEHMLAHLKGLRCVQSRFGALACVSVVQHI